MRHAQSERERWEGYRFTNALANTMQYPLENWKTLKRGYVFGVPTFYSKFHLGVDVVCPVGTKIYAPLSGTVTGLVGAEGGITIHLKTSTHLIRFLHLSKILKTGEVKEGDLIALTGNTGVSTGPHTHVDVSKGNLDLGNTANFIDPEIFFKPMYRLIRAQKDVYRVKDGKKDLFVNGKAFQELDGRWDAIETINQADLDAIPNGNVLIVVPNE